ncbi:nickel pincer cofactor biosynthesis protein LarB [Pseudodesulfovibrio tunisiensis]|uniref:nickel pincer cofactor biosynthesis protein LarB n=1 Tax=Pseudodesulfovibrio tunisiensis TaxID=463192 RepID=UPI001FB5463E|nr:nickel pincer cofactor biosynthesis protein LarB [Pseudodesulfovibrio tunisiensis]
MSMDALLDELLSGRMDREDFKRQVLDHAFLDAGCARLDVHRQKRTGGPEVVYCESKSPEQVAEIFDVLDRENGAVLGTRATPAHAEAVRTVLKDVEYDPVSRLLQKGGASRRSGRIVVVSAGTSDAPVAEEAAQTAEFLGSNVERHYDCGVAGIHRLFSVAGSFCGAGAVIAVAGMEGALPSVVGGLSEPPVIAVPTSVGYGANFGGLAALLAMMNACAPGIGVVNIDNGFGAGFLAHKINARTLAPGRE